MLLFQKLDKAVHDRKSFSCGVPELDRFLKQYAAQNQAAGNSITYVLVDDETPAAILGYVTLSAAELEFEALSTDDLKHFPRYPVPAISVGRLAVSLQNQGRGYGGALLGFATRQALKVGEIAGVRVLLVDAKDDEAARFYKHFGFAECIHHRLTLYLVI